MYGAMLEPQPALDTPTPETKKGSVESNQRCPSKTIWLGVILPGI
jgi:hypothetical protein